MPHFWSKQLLWIGFFFVGFISTVIIHRLPAMRRRVLRASRGVQRGFATTFYLSPLLISPLFRLPWLIATSSDSIPVLRRQQRTS